MANRFSAQTVASSSQEVSCHQICDDSKELLPDQFDYLMIDALARATGVGIAGITADQLRTATNDAECALGELRSYASSTPKVRQQIMLFLANQVLGG